MGADEDDPLAAYRDIADKSLAAGAIEHFAAANDRVVSRGPWPGRADAGGGEYGQRRRGKMFHETLRICMLLAPNRA